MDKSCKEDMKKSYLYHIILIIFSFLDN